MKISFSPFRTLDQFIFKQLDQFKSTTFFQKSYDRFLSLDEEQQKLINHGLIVAAIIIPIVFTFSFFISNSFLKNELSVKHEIYNNIIELQNKKNKLNNLGREILGPNIITTQQQLQARLGVLSTMYNLPNAKISVKSFNVIKQSESFFHSKNVIGFSGLATKQLTQLFKGIINTEKAQLVSLKIDKNTTDELLFGEMTIIVYSRKQ